MKVVEAQGFSIDRLRLVERPKPEPRRGDILLRVRAASLNYRDLAVLSGTYLPNLPLPYVPVSDACGVVESVGEGVTRFAPGDRVVPCYIQGWRDGALTREQRFGATLGGPLPGVRQAFVVVPADDAVCGRPRISPTTRRARCRSGRSRPGRRLRKAACRRVRRCSCRGPAACR